MTALQIIKILQQISAEQFDTETGRERREALNKAVEALKYLERTKWELEMRRLNDGR